MWRGRHSESFFQDSDDRVIARCNTAERVITCRDANALRSAGDARSVCEQVFDTKKDIMPGRNLLCKFIYARRRVRRLMPTRIPIGASDGKGKNGARIVPSHRTPTVSADPFTCSNFVFDVQ